MKKTITALMLASTILLTKSYGQSQSDQASFHGAEATLKEYKALYIINQSDDKKIRATLRNINNALGDERLKGKLQVELVAFGDGVELFKKSNHYDTLLNNLQQKGVLLAECENTVRERKIDKADLWPFISYVPSGQRRDHHPPVPGLGYRASLVAFMSHVVASIQRGMAYII